MERPVLRRASRADLPSHSAAKEILDAYITAKLFVSHRDQAGEPTIALAHAALLTAWPRVQRWVHGNQQFLREKARIREARRQYLEENKSYSYLLPRGKQLKAGRQLLKKRRHELSPEEISFIRRSSRRARVRAGVLSAGLVSAVALSLILLGVLAVAALLSSNGVNPHEYYVLVTQQYAKGYIQRRSGNKTVALREYQKGLDGSLSLNVPVALRFFDMEACYRMLELITDTGAADPADATLEKIYGLASDIAKSQEQSLLESDHVVVELSEAIGRFLFERGRWQKSAKYYDRRLTWLRERTKRNPSDKANQEEVFYTLKRTGDSARSPSSRALISALC